MTRRPSRSILGAVAALVLAAGLVTSGPASAQEPPPPPPAPETTAPPPAPPQASIVVDVETGEVILASNAREPLPPASTTKILTALLVRDRLDYAGDIEVSDIAAIAPPRRIQLPPRSRWGVEDLTYAMLHCSCNDAAWALGQAAGGGTMPGFEAAAGELALELGLEDGPVIRDPAGLDDDRSIGGGNLLSARDLAIAARAFLADPVLTEVAASPGHEWVGGDDKPHSVTNLNRFLTTYDGAIGLKTGSTARAGLTFVGAARRDGRTLVAVVLGSQDHYGNAAYLLDQGFLLAATGVVTDDVLPDVAAGPGGTTTTTTSTTTTSTTTTTTTEGSGPPTDTADRTGGATTAPRSDGADDDDVPVVPIAAGAGGGVVALGAGTALLVRRRRRRGRGGIDRRPARPRRRDRRRAGRT